MREVVYAGGSFITSDEIAEALLEYAAELANLERAATIEVPAVGASGESRDVRIVVGPASQLLSEPVESAVNAPDATAFMTDVEERTRELRRHHGMPPQGSQIDWDI